MFHGIHYEFVARKFSGGAGQTTVHFRSQDGLATFLAEVCLRKHANSRSCHSWICVMGPRAHRILRAGEPEVAPILRFESQTRGMPGSSEQD